MEILSAIRLTLLDATETVPVTQAAETAASKFENFIGFNPWTALLTLFNLILVFLILKKFLFKPVKKMIDDRRKEIDDTYADAERAKAEAEQMKADYEKQIAGAKDEAAEIVRSAGNDARRESDEIIRSAKTEASAIKQKAMDDIALEKKKAVNEAKDDIVGIAMDIAGKVVEKELTQSDHEALIEDFIRKMGEEQ